MARKLGRTAEERMAIIRNQASELLWFGSIETTVDRAKEVRSYAESMLTLAINTYNDTVKVTKTVKSDKGEVQKEFVNDGPKKLAARRKLMASLRDIQELKNEGESKSAYKARTKDVAHPLIEKLFNEIAPKYAQRNDEKNCAGGYTRIIPLGTRRGDAAEVAVIELV